MTLGLTEVMAAVHTQPTLIGAIILGTPIPMAMVRPTFIAAHVEVGHPAITKRTTAPKASHFTIRSSSCGYTAYAGWE